MKSIKHYLKAIKSRSCTALYSRKGWKTNRKIVVFESDDWGSIRMPSLNVYNELLRSNLDVDNFIYNKYDSLATKDDLHELYRVLLKFRDKNGRHPILTANTCVTNPDFIKIKNNDFNNYYYENFTQTISNYKDCSFDVWQEGIENKIFKPQLHGREHLNIFKWMNELRDNNNDLLTAFSHNCWGISYLNKQGAKDHVLQEFLVNDNNSIVEHSKALKDSAMIFEEIFGFKSKSFIAPNYTWNHVLNNTLHEIGIESIQGGYIQHESKDGKLSNDIIHYMGQYNDIGQTYLVRNCLWEPTQNKKINNNYCLKGIENAFNLNKPAIVCSHRLNFIGAIESNNRDVNLKEFTKLLKTIIIKWPDVEFMSSDELGDIIKISQNRL